MSLKDRDGRPRRCPYCGTRIAGLRACQQCAKAALNDPHRLASGRSLTEAELGIVIPWPEGEASDEPDDAA